jgi:hypothetical protein
MGHGAAPFRAREDVAGYLSARRGSGASTPARIRLVRSLGQWHVYETPDRADGSSRNCRTYSRYPRGPPRECHKRMDLRSRFKHRRISETDSSPGRGSSSRGSPSFNVCRPSRHSQTCRHCSYTTRARPGGPGDCTTLPAFARAYPLISELTAASTSRSVNFGFPAKTVTMADSMFCRTSAYSSSTLIFTRSSHVRSRR